MINEEELRISNKSYINKDFASIYPEVVELVQKLTDLWNPETSNESDPGVVILKLLSFIADKNNYNIDKNVLECFMPSATQESSMRKLCDMLGYFMNYYNAPSTNLTITYVGNMDNKNPIQLNALDTVFTNDEENSDISFILTENVTLQEPNDVQVKPVIQGRLKELLVNTSGDYVSNTSQSITLIQLNNLDDNNRLYFPEINVAQNGVFISDNSSDYNYVKDDWKVVKNLNYQKADEKCFKFGFDSTRGLPYIEFPKDIANLIGNGLYIRYVVTDGLNGNVKANVINKLASSSYDWSGNGYEDGDEGSLFVRNYSATLNGKDPETINEAYNGFKKTIGTFNTLVSCRDYSNAIYNSFDSDDIYPLVSNVQVSDRRDDINYSKRVVSYDDLGDVVLNKTDSSELNAYELCAYTLAPIYSYTDTSSYNNSFTPLTKASKTVTQNIVDAIEGNKAISHDFKDLDSSAVYCFKNKLSLNGRLTTNYKVNANEVVDIDINVINQLITDFNAREVDFGYEIPYDSLVNSIQNADKRINYVSLMEPSLTTWIMDYTGAEHELISVDGQGAYINLLAKNILNGNIALYDYDDRFNYELGQTKISGIDMVTENIAKIETELAIELTDNTNKELFKNEAIQLIGPNVVTKLTYPAYCYFRFESTVHDVPSRAISRNTIYKLGAGEKLYMCYTQNDVQHCDLYEEGKIIQANFSLYATPNDNDHYVTYERSAFKKSTEYGDLWFYSLGAQEQIEIKEVNVVEITKKTKCYWLRNNAGNVLFTDDDWDNTNGGEILLGENEYFFYTDASETQLISLQSGTTIKTKLSSIKNVGADVVSIESVIEKGLVALKDKWKLFDFSGTNNELIIQENNILTLTDGDLIKVVYSSGATPITTSSILTPLPNTVTDIYYTITSSGEGEQPLDMYSIDNDGWKIRSVLHINVTKDEPQIINEGFNGVGTRQTVKFYTGSNATNPPTLTLAVTLNTSNQYFNLNTELHSDSGIIDTSLKVNNVYTFPVSVYCYTIPNGVELPERPDNIYAKYVLTNDPNPATVFTYNLPMVDTLVSGSAVAENSILMIHYLKSDAGSGDVVLSMTNCEMRACSSSSNTFDDDPISLVEGINVFEIKRSGANVPTITLTNNGTVGFITVGTLDFIKGLNPALSLSTFSEKTGVLVADLTTALMNAIRDSDFYYNCKIDNSKALAYDDILSPYAFYDANNRANKFTISQIDFDSSDIDVVRSSKL